MEGVNSRLDGLQAAILNVKLPHLAAWTEARRRVASHYDELLTGVGDIVTPKIGRDRDHVYHLYVIRTGKRDALKKHLTDAGIATVLNYPKALPFYPAYDYLGHKPADFPVAYANQSRILSLPIFPEMTDEMLAYVVETNPCFFQTSHMHDGVNYIVISPVRNEQDYIHTTIQSLVSQTNRPALWIIVDDGSTDKTSEIIDVGSKPAQLDTGLAPAGPGFSPRGQRGNGGFPRRIQID